MSAKRKSDKSKSGGGGLFSKLRRSTSDLSEWGKQDDKLYAAVSRNDIEKMRALLAKKGVHADKQAPDGSTAIHKAAQEGRFDAIKLFITHKVDVNVTDNTGRSPLHYTCRLRHHKLTQLLLEAGANVGAVDPNQLSPMHDAALGGSVEVVRVLVIHPQTEVDLRDKFGRTSLHYSAQQGFDTICTELLNKGADVNAADSEGRTPLMLAAESGYAPVAEVLIGWGASLRYTDRQGFNAGWYAHNFNRREVKEILQNAALIGSSLDLEPQAERSVDLKVPAPVRSHTDVVKQRPLSTESEDERPLVNGPIESTSHDPDRDLDTAIVPMHEMMKEDGHSLSSHSDDLAAPEQVQIRMDDIDLVPLPESAAGERPLHMAEVAMVAVQRQEILEARARPPTRTEAARPPNYSQLEEDYELLQAELQRTALENKHLNQRLLKLGDGDGQLGGSRSEIDLRDLSDFEGLQEAHEREVQELRDENADVVTKNRALSEQLLAMGDCREYMEEELGKLTEFLAELKAETEVPVDARLEELQENSRRQEETIGEIHNTIANLKAKTAAAGSADMLADFYNETDELRQENAELQDNNVELRMTVEKVQRQIDSFQELSNINEDLMKENDGLREEYNKLHDHLKNMRDEPLVIDGPEDLVQITNDLQQENSVLRANNERLVNQLRGLQHNVDRTMKNLPSYEDFMATKNLNEAQKAEIEQLKEAVAKQNDLLLDVEDEMRKNDSGLDMEVMARLLEEKRCLQLELEATRADNSPYDEAGVPSAEHEALKKDFERLQEEFTALARPDDSSDSDSATPDVAALQMQLNRVRDERNMLLMDLGESHQDREVMEKAAMENLQLKDELEAFKKELDSRVGQEQELKKEVERVQKELNKRPKVEITKRVEIETIEGPTVGPDMVEKVELDKAIHELQREKRKKKSISDMVPTTELIALQLVNATLEQDKRDMAEPTAEAREHEAETVLRLANLESDRDKQKNNLKEVKAAFIELAKKSAPLHEHQQLQEKYKKVLKENDQYKQNTVQRTALDDVKKENKELRNKLSILPIIEKEKDILNKEKMNALEENKGLMGEIIKLKTECDKAKTRQMHVMPEMVVMEQTQMMRSGRPRPPQSVSDSSDEDDMEERFSKEKMNWEDDKENMSSEILGLTNTLKEQSKLLDGTEQYNEALATENEKVTEELNELKRNLAIKNDTLRTKEDELDSLKHYLDGKTEDVRVSDEVIDRLKERLEDSMEKTRSDDAKSGVVVVEIEKQLHVTKKENIGLREKLDFNKGILERQRKDLEQRDILIIGLSKDNKHFDDIVRKYTELETEREMNKQGEDDLEKTRVPDDVIERLRERLEDSMDRTRSDDVKSGLLIAEMEEQLDNIKKENISLRGQLDFNKDIFERQRKDLDERDTLIIGLSKDKEHFDDIVQKNNELEKDLQRINSRISNVKDNDNLILLELQREKTKLVEDNLEQSKEIGALKSALKTTEDSEQRAQKEKNNIHTVNEKLLEDNASLHDTVIMLQDRVKGVPVKMSDESRKELEQAKKDMDGLLKDKTKLEADNKELMKDIDLLREALYDKPIPEVQEPEQILMTQSAPMTAAAAPSQIKEQEEVMDKLKDENKRLKDDIDKYIKNIDTLNKEHDDEIKQSLRRIEEVEDNNKIAENDMVEMKKSFGDIFDRMQKDKEVEKDRAKQLQHKKNKVQAEKQELEDDMDDLRHVLDERCKELQDKDNIEAENKRLHKDHGDLQKQIKLLAESDRKKFKLLEDDNDKYMRDIEHLKKEHDDEIEESLRRVEEVDNKKKDTENDMEDMKKSFGDIFDRVQKDKEVEEDRAKQFQYERNKVQADKQQLEDDMDDLRHILEERSKELQDKENVETENKRLKKDNEDVRKRIELLAESDREKFKLLEDNEKLYEELCDNKAELEDLKKTIKEVENELQEKKEDKVQRDKELEEKGKQGEEEVTFLRETVLDMRDNINSLEDELSREKRSKMEIEDIYRECDRLRQKVSEMENVIEDQKSLIERYEDEKEREKPGPVSQDEDASGGLRNVLLGALAPQAMEDYKKLEDENDKLKHDVEDLSQEISLQKAIIDDLEKKPINQLSLEDESIDALKYENEHLSADVNHLKDLLQRKTDELLNENENLLDKNELLEHEVSELQDKTKTQKQKEEEVKSELDKSIGEIVAIRLENKYLTSEKDALQDTLKKKEDVIKALLVKPKDGASKHSEILSPAEHAILMDERKELKNKIEQLGDELVISKKNHESERDDLIDKCVVLRNENEKMEDEIRQMHDTNDQAAGLVAAGLMNGFADLEGSSNTDSEMLRLTEARNVLVEDNDRLQAENAKLRGRLALLGRIRDKDGVSPAVAVTENHMSIEPVQLLVCESAPRATKELVILTKSKDELPLEVADLVEAYREEMDRADLIQRDALILKANVKDITYEQLQMKGEVEDAALKCVEMETEMDRIKDDNQYLQTENKDLREIMAVIEQSHHISTETLVSRLHKENNKLQEFISVLGNQVEVISPQQSPRAPQNRLETAELMTLTKQLNDERQKHKDIVMTYRTHLLASVQDQMDPEVKKALLHIVRLRDPDPV